MADPRETLKRLTQTLQQAQQRGRGGFPGGAPRGLFGGAGAVVLLIGGGIFLNNALFNGILPLNAHVLADILTRIGFGQLTVDIAQLSTLE
jgi:hypothetical protein